MNISAPSMNIVAEIWKRADLEPNRVALRSQRGDLTYRVLRLSSERAAGAMRDLGVSPGDRVLLIAPSVVEFAIAYYGLHALGAIVITMNTGSTNREIGYVIDDAEVSVVVAWHECVEAATVAAAVRDLPLLTIEDGGRFDAEPLTSVHQYSPTDTSVILYTSGTTGSPKGAELTVANIVGTMGAVREIFALTEHDRFGTALPLFHVFGQIVVMNTTLAVGGTLSLLSPFDAISMLGMLRRDRLTAIAGVPTMWHALLAEAYQYGPEDFTGLRLAVSGGASLPGVVIDRIRDKFGVELLEGYGLTETTGASTFNGISRPTKVGSVGSAVPGTAIEIRDGGGRPVEIEARGEVYLKGRGVMKGYWNRPEATDADLVDGWLRTGDIGFLDSDGYLFLVDRAKDLIIRGGYNVYPREVEDVLHQHPQISEVAVIGVPDVRVGEEIGAVVVRATAATVTAQEIREWAEARLSKYKVPRLYQFADALPRGATGKILKRALDRDSLRNAERARASTSR